MNRIRLIPIKLLLLLMMGFIISSCNQSNDKNRLIVFHAGSLSVPFKQLADAFNKENPEAIILREAAGSRKCARKITDLDKDCDIMASADYTVIDQLLIPDHAEWNIKFASNEMVIVFTEKSACCDLIDSDNWYKALFRDDVTYGRADPNSDPCGYRTVLTMKLAELLYKEDGLADRLIEKDNKYIRPKETDLLALLETGDLDYVFIYRSVAEQHHLNYVTLPDSINLKLPELREFYAQASVDISGKEIGEYITKKGEPMVYGLTVLKNAPNKKLAMKFVDFILSDKGIAIMEANGQPSVIPSMSESYDAIPTSLKKYALPYAQ